MDIGGISGGSFDYASYGGAAGVGSADDVASVATTDDLGIGGGEDTASAPALAEDSSLLSPKGQTSEIDLGGLPSFSAPIGGSDLLAGVFPESGASSAAPDSSGSGSIDVTHAGRALADKFGTDQAWSMAKTLRDNAAGHPEMQQAFRDTLGQDLNPEQMRDVEHYLYARSDVANNDGVASKALAAAKMATLTTGYSALKAVAQHTGNTELEKNAAQYWSKAADDVPTDGSALHAAEYVGAKIMEKVVSPIDIRNALGMGSNVKSSKATVSEVLSGLSGTLDGLIHGKK